MVTYSLDMAGKMSKILKYVFFRVFLDVPNSQETKIFYFCNIEVQR